MENIVKTAFQEVLNIQINSTPDPNPVWDPFENLRY